MNMTRARRVAAALAAWLIAAGPLAAQVSPVILAPAAEFAASAPLAPAFGAAAFAAPSAAAAPVLAASLAPTLSAAPSVAVAPAFAAAPAAAASPRAAAAAAVSVSAVAASAPRSAPALDGFIEGRRVFDGAAAAEPSSPVPPVPVVAPRGEAVSFSGISLPTRMFSDQTQISSHLIAAIDATRRTLDIAIYELAISEVRDALVRAKSRGVAVRVVMDQGHVYPTRGQRTPETQSLIDAGFALRTLRGGDAHGIMHNKFAVFDGALMETGSYNWTRAADDRHFENALFDVAPRRIASYQNYWDWMWAQARPFTASAPAPVAIDEHGHTPPLASAPQDADAPIVFNGVSFPRESFSPHGTAARIAAAIDAARVGVDLANFSFTDTEIIAALRRAKERGLPIRLIFDIEQFQFLADMGEMAKEGFNVRLSGGRQPRGVMHNKFGVFDGRLVETGSFNWTMNGELNNYENAAFLDAPDDAGGYAAYFERIWRQARAPRPGDFPTPRPAPAGPGR